MSIKDVKPLWEPKQKSSTGLDFCFCGSGEIRTHDELPHAGFQDRCLQPLGHTSFQYSGLEEYSIIFLKMLY